MQRQGDLRDLREKKKTCAENMECIFCSRVDELAGGERMGGMVGAGEGSMRIAGIIN